MKIRGNTVGTPLKPEKIISEPRPLTEEQKAQARENIGAVGYAYVDAEIDALNDDIEGIERDLTGVKNNIIGIEQTIEENEANIAKNSDAIDELQKAVGGGGSKDTVLYTEQELTPAKQAQARANIGAAIYYHTTREEVGKAHDDINAAYIFSLYDALMETYPDRVQKVAHTNNDGTFTNYEYVISTGDYPAGTYSVAYGDDTDHINKPKYLVLNSIHGDERKTTLSTYRFILDVLSGHNIPPAFSEGAIISVMPVGTPSAFDAFDRYNENGVNINRNFDWNWDANGDNTGSYAASEKETQAIANWLSANDDAELFIDFHNNGALAEKVLILGLSNSIADTSKKIALRGVDRIIPYWKDVIGYPDTVEAEGFNDDGTGLEVKERDVIFSYCASADVGGLAYGYAQEVLGIRSIALETAPHYGDHSEWVDDIKTYSPEAIAMGAEALGNILIEFYARSCEVVEMNKIEEKLDDILNSVNTGFRVESGTIVLEEDMLPASGSAYFTFKIPCSNGAKIIDFHPDSETMAAIRLSSGIYYTAGVIGNNFAPEVIGNDGTQTGFMMMLQDYTAGDVNYGWVILPGTLKTINTDGVTFKCYALKAGTYHWKAYYWND